MTAIELLAVGFLLAVWYVYIGYPLLLWGLSIAYQSPVRKGDDQPSVSLIISAYNEKAVIAEKIKNALETVYPREKLEIIVVTDGSDDNTPEIARGFATDGVIVLHSPERRGKSAAMNRAASKATGEIIVFSDANAFYEPHAVLTLVRNFSDPDVGVASGQKTVLKTGSKVGQSEAAYWSYEGFIRSKETETGSTTGVVGEINAIRSKLFKPIPGHIVNDDAYLALSTLREGHRVVYEADALSWETSAASIGDEVVRRQRINAGRFQQLFTPSLWGPIDSLTKLKLFSHKFMRLFLPIFMAGAFATNFIVMTQASPSQLLQITFWLQALFYLLAVVGVLEDSLQQRLVPGARIAHYLVASNLAALKGLARFLLGGQSVLWTKARRGDDR